MRRGTFPTLFLLTTQSGILTWWWQMSVVQDLHHNDRVKSVIIGPLWHMMSVMMTSSSLPWWWWQTWVWLVPGTGSVGIITWQIWWWWDCDSDWCLPPVTPGLPSLLSLSSLRVSLRSWARALEAARARPGSDWRPGPVSAGPESAVHGVLHHHWPHHPLITVISVTPSSLLCPVCHPGVRNDRRTLVVSSGHPDPGGRARSRLPVSRIPKLFH